MKILKFETNSQLDKSLATVLDLQLRTFGFEALGLVNFIVNSIQNVPEQQVVVSEVAAPQPETQAEPQPELVVEP